MTFNDLSYIEKTFTKILLSVHHHRIPYPELRRVSREDLAMEEDAPAPSPGRPEKPAARLGADSADKRGTAN
jgi:hypothetical protein